MRERPGRSPSRCFNAWLAPPPCAARPGCVHVGAPRPPVRRDEVPPTRGARWRLSLEANAIGHLRPPLQSSLAGVEAPSGRLEHRKAERPLPPGPGNGGEREVVDRPCRGGLHDALEGEGTRGA